MSLHHEDVLQILALLDASDFDELRLETSEYKLFLRRSAPEGATVEPRPQANVPHVPSAVAATPLPPSPPPPSPPAPDAAATSAVVSPMVGVFYASPPRGAAPFVQPGSAVDIDTIVGIVEVMKLMNAVPAGVRGVVTEVVARDGDVVEYGGILVRVAVAKP